MSSSGKGDAAIALRDVYLSLESGAGQVSILRGINLTIDKGEAVGLVGPSGSGKTSLLMLISGLERSTAGHIQVGEHDVSSLDEDSLAEFRRDEVGIVFQSFHLVPTMTALENVALPLELGGYDGAFEQARTWLDRVGLGERVNHYPSQLSGGEQQRVALARAFVGEPRVLLADEPTGNLDGATGAAVIELLFDLHRRSGSTLMLITHDPVLAQLCDRIIEMQDGRVVGDEIQSSEPRVGPAT